VSRLFLPIFPLPDVVFFPHTLLPLHIFEARYRAMVTDALARDRRLAVVGLRPGYEANYEGKPAVHAVAGAGEIVQCTRLATGRYNLLLRGECRIRIDHELATDTLYRLVVATRLEDVGDDGPAVTALASEVRARCRQVLQAIGRSPTDLDEVLDQAAPPGVICDQVAAALLPGPEERQAVLEERDVERRLRRLSEALAGLLKDVGGER
jgi:uncharacterized protein